MNILDLLLLAATAWAGYVAYRHGPLRQVCTATGAFLGLFAAAFLYTKLAFLIEQSGRRALLLGALTLGVGFLCYDIALTIGNRLQKRHGERHHRHGSSLPRWQRALSVLVSGTTCLVGLWLLCSMFSGLSFVFMQRQIQDSVVVAQLNKAVGLPPLVRQVGQALRPFGSPQAFIGTEPTFSSTMPILSEQFTNLDKATATAKASVVKISAWGCGSVSVGTGFMVSPNRIVTNAHVIAGADRMSVVSNGNAFTAQAVWFDPNLDVAILETASSLSAAPLKLYAGDVPAGSIGSLIGYPGGNGLTIGDVIVVQSLRAEGYDIYGKAPVTRKIYALRAGVVPGDSGSPLLGANGQVIGLIFGHSTTQNQTGYALTSDQVRQLVNAAAARQGAVLNGACAT